MREHARISTNIASGALVVVFVGLLLFTMLGIATIRGAAHRTQAAVSLSQQYEYVERELWKEASLVRVHGLNWQNSDWYANVVAEHAAAQAIDATLGQIAQRGTDTNRGFVVQALADHAKYVGILRQLFAEIDANAHGAGATFERSTRLFEMMQSRIDRHAANQHAIANAALTELDQTQTQILKLMLLATAIGGALLAASAYVIMRYRAVIERVRSAELQRFAQASLTDTLTGLGNHRAYQEGFECELARNVHDGRTVSLALIDVDNFKTVNDTQGHIEGDRVLSTLGTLLLGLRKSDRGFRLGGDEFALVLPDTDLSDALATMERLRQDAAALLGCTISIGISSTAGQDIDAIALRAQADSALYAAKHRGRNSVMAYADARGHALVPATEKRGLR